MALVAIPLVEFAIGSHVNLLYESTDGTLRQLQGVNASSDFVIIGWLKHGSRELKQKLLGPGQSITVNIPVPFRNAIGARTAKIDSDGAYFSWDNLEIGFQWLPMGHPEA